MKNLSITYVNGLGNLEVEVVERKGIGHPDTIADALAEHLSVSYSLYTLSHFGAILHHNFDKVSVLGGATEIDYGVGKITSPIRVIINGRASGQFSDQIIPVRDILESEVCSFFSDFFGNILDIDRDLKIYWFVSNSSGPGKTKQSTGSRANLFAPQNISEVKGYDNLLNNDTSMGCGYAPLSPTETAVLKLEKILNSQDEKRRYPWLGTDIKVMASRVGVNCNITICLPQVAMYVLSIDEYLYNLDTIKSRIQEILSEILPNMRVVLSTNTRDNILRGDIYLTAIGSSIEAGDEGIVGRGNRVNGLITPLRPINLEGVCGKNPKYYTGKLYNVAAHRIAERIYKATQSACEVFLVSQAGQPIIDPWSTMIRTSQHFVDKTLISQIAEEELNNIPNITEDLLMRKIQLY